MQAARRWLGIPYATAARFARPTRVPWNGDLTPGGEFGPAAPQLPGDDVVPDMKVGATDEARCLSLNVWAPAGPNGAAAGGDPRPVLVWFHGGAFVLGASSQASHAGDRLAAEQDVVVVSANYRLGALGFLDTRAIGGDAANFGLHDAIAALQWVQRQHRRVRWRSRRASPCSVCPPAAGSVCTCSPRPPRPACSPASSSRAASPTARWTRRAPRWSRRRLCEAAGVTDIEGLRDARRRRAARGAGDALVALLEAGRRAAVPSVRRRRAGARCPGRDARRWRGRRRSGCSRARRRRS